MDKNNNKQENFAPWSLTPEKLFDYLKTSDKGLTKEEAENRLEKYGFNEIAKKDRRRGLEIFFSQFTNPLVFVLIIAALVAYFLGETVNAGVVLAIVILNASLGFFEEYRAERALRLLRKFITVRAKVLRGSGVVDVDAKELVPGDVVYLDIGDIVPADVRLLEVEEMTTDESSLTGESMPVHKKITVIEKQNQVPQYLYNMAFMGTTVSGGEGKGVVAATGKDTILGKTAVYLKQENLESDFQKNIRKFGNLLMKVILSMTLFVFLANALLGKEVFDSFLFAIALAVGIIPEVLPILITIAFSKGALKMAKEKVIVKKLVAVEDLGNMDTLCCDKTGTLTEGKLSLEDHINLNGRKEERILSYGLLCSSVKGRGVKKTFGNSIDAAVWQHSRAKILEDKIKGYVVLDVNEFDFERRRMSVVVKDDQARLMIVKGAPESVLQVSRWAIWDGKKQELSKQVIEGVMGKLVAYENKGYRVLAVAERAIKENKVDKKEEKDLILIGFLLFLDPPKETAKIALTALRQLKVDVKVISGDSAVVTRKICGDVGLKLAEDRVISGEELARLRREDFAEYSHKYNVFARVTPEQKYKIVETLNHEGHIVGFLGDGINDAPALKMADVGISVDSASGIAKEAADVIILRKSLRVVVDGIREGRKIFGNVTKYILNTISANFGNMFTVAVSSLFLKFIPLLPSQILLNNFMSDIPLLTITTDNVDEEFLHKPKRWNLKLITRFMIIFGLIGTFFDLSLIFSLLFIFKADPALFRTAWFVESALSEIIVTFAIRTKLPFFKSHPSRWLILASLVVGLTVITVTYLSFGHSFFEFVHMPWPVAALVAGVLASYFIAAEIAKRFCFKKFDL